MSEASLEQGDANGDGIIDGADLTILENQFGTPISLSASTAIPEPSAAGLAALAGLLFWTVRRPYCN